MDCHSKLIKLKCNQTARPNVLNTVDTKRDLFWSLLEAEHAKAESFCRRLAGNKPDGDDLYQDSLLAAMERIGRLREKSAFKPWLYRIIVNNFVSSKRRSWWRKRVPLTTEIIETLPGDDPSEKYNARRWIEIGMENLKPEECALVILFEIEGWTVAELAKLHKRPTGTIKARLVRARLKMRQSVVRHLSIENETFKKKEAQYALPRSET
jgi:RNA polymerase sigma factor (sigma-70 family)